MISRGLGNYMWGWAGMCTLAPVLSENSEPFIEKLTVQPSPMQLWTDLSANVYSFWNRLQRIKLG